MALFRKLLRRGGSKNNGQGAYEQFSKDYAMTDVVLGTGSYAEVRKARRKRTNEIVAVKIIDKTGLNARELKGLSKEVRILQSLKHRNVVKFYDAYEEDDVMYVVMEYVGGGELFQKIITEDSNFKESDAKRIIRTLAEALKHCKEKGVIHRDIKPQNLLLTSKEQGEELKLADFNLSIQVDPSSVNFSILQTMCGTPNYVAPEILSQKPYDFKCDIWSLGVIAFLLLSGGYLPFYVEEEGELGKDLLLKKVRRGRWGFYPAEAWQNVSDEAKDFLTKVMVKNPEQRLDYDGVLAHSWLRADTKCSDVPINTQHLKQDRFRRLLFCAGTVYEAASVFKGLMEDIDDPKDASTSTTGKINTNPFLDQSGDEAFEVILE